MTTSKRPNRKLNTKIRNELLIKDVRIFLEHEPSLEQVIKKEICPKYAISYQNAFNIIKHAN